jgi:hypothetical protein
MSKRQFEKKSGELIDAFNNYILEHPTKVPFGSYIFLTRKGDNKFNEEILERAKHIRTRKTKIEAQRSGSRWLIKPLAL